MKRAQATQLVEQMLARLIDGRGERPLSMITEVRVFGSYARGSSDPGDVDIMIDFRRDWEWSSEAASLLMSGRDPFAPVRRALNGGKRSLQIQCEALPDVTEVVVLWREGDTLSTAVARLHAIAEVSGAGRAPRDAMLPAFEGLDRWLGRDIREALVAANDAGGLAIERLELPDELAEQTATRQHIARRWSTSSPLHRAAHAAMRFVEEQGVGPADVRLHGQNVAGSRPTVCVGMQQRYWRGIPGFLAQPDGQEWIEVVRPTARQPLIALRIRPRSREVLASARW